MLSPGMWADRDDLDELYADLKRRDRNRVSRLWGDRLAAQDDPDAVLPEVTRWLIDSSVLVDASRARGAERDLAVGFLKDAPLVTANCGVSRLSARKSVGRCATTKRALIDELFDSILWLDVTTLLADRAGDHGRRWGRSHGLGVVDAIVAAATEQLDARLATLNIRDFPMFPDLQPPY